VPFTETLTSMPPSSPDSPLLEEEELEEEDEAVLPVEPVDLEGMPGIDGELDPEEVWLGMLGIEGEDELDEDGEELGIEGDDLDEDELEDEELEDELEDELGIDGLELLELEEDEGDWQPASTTQAITAAATGFIIRAAFSCASFLLRVICFS
jgi:FAD/FMN-containing dehydrogenase